MIRATETVGAELDAVLLAALGSSRLRIAGADLPTLPLRETA
jgi:hypothetical protein